MNHEYQDLTLDTIIVSINANPFLNTKQISLASDITNMLECTEALYGQATLVMNEIAFKKINNSGFLQIITSDYPYIVIPDSANTNNLRHYNFDSSIFAFGGGLEDFKSGKIIKYFLGNLL